MAVQRASVEEKRQRDQYRRRRPYLVVTQADKAAFLDTSASSWQVLDMDSREVLGKIGMQVVKEKEQYSITEHLQAGDKMPTERTYSTMWLAADAVWKTAYSHKWWVWKCTRFAVLSADWVLRMFKIFTILFAVAIVVGSIPDIWKARKAILDYIIELPAQRNITETPRQDT